MKTAWISFRNSEEDEAAVGNDFIIMFRLSMLDLVAKGSTWEEIVLLAKNLEKEGSV